MSAASPEQPTETIDRINLNYERKRAKRKQEQATETEKKAGRFLATVLHDLRDSLRSKRERRVLYEEEQKSRINNPWTRNAWRDYTFHMFK